MNLKHRDCPLSFLFNANTSLVTKPSAPPPVTRSGTSEDRNGDSRRANDIIASRKQFRHWHQRLLGRGEVPSKKLSAQHHRRIPSDLSSFSKFSRVIGVPSTRVSSAGCLLSFAQK